MTDKFLQFIETHKDGDVAALRLKYANSKDSDIDYSLAITQIECRRKYGKKLKETLAAAHGKFLFPNTLSGEQSSSDAMAQWHASLVTPCSTVTDMTAGLGIDAMHIATVASKVTAVERNEDLARTLQYNANVLGLDNLTVEAGDSTEMITSGTLSSDVVFIDPARRTATGARAFAISDCQPDIRRLLPDMQRHFKLLIAKLSPMLDISDTCRALPGITDIYAVGTHLECKEVVAQVNLHVVQSSDAPTVHAITIDSGGNVSDLAFTVAQESAAIAPIAKPQIGDTLYEPFPAILKAGAFNTFASEYGLSKIGNNTHIYISTTPQPNIPANAYRIVDIVPWQSKYLKRLNKTYPVAQVAVRNFGMTADALRNKLNIRNGGETRILGVTDNNAVRQLLILQTL